MSGLSLETMAWIIGCANPLSALCTGPMLIRLGAPPHIVRRAQGFGWAILVVGQAVFLTYGIVSDLAGFKFAQPMMIVVAALNFTVWWGHRPTARPVPEKVRPGVD